ncbi:putative WD repeat-containing protein [Acropora cervicornis]|uniref:WD repeat-containing protein n=2 Tax=Acropora TaxID=6127 RepID=A0AAD9QJ54_ACRCE|nr:putative WD repeat-containing protein [Acropora cervicornis]
MSFSRSPSSSPTYEKRLVFRLQGHEGAVVFCAVDPKAKLLATCSTDRTINVWTITTGQLLRALKGGHTEEVTSCSFCSIGPILASSSIDKKVILWNYESGKRASRLELHHDAVLFCAFSKDGKFLASASRDKTARIYKIRPGAGEFVPGGDVKELSGHKGAVNVVKFSPDGAVALTGSDDRTIRAWKRENDWECVCVLNQFTAPIKSVIFSPVDPVFASLDGNRTTLWTMKGQKYEAENSVDIRSSEKQLKAVSFIPDGRFIMGVATDKTINIWDSVKKNTWLNLPNAKPNQHEGAILTCCFAGRNFISADADGFTFIWELV